jgi:hypothetical protein
MKRRTWLAAPAVWVVGVAAGGSTFPPVQALPAASFDKLAGLFAPLRDAHRLGLIYLQQHPVEAHAEVLARLVTGRAWADVLPMAPADLTRAITARQAVDFAAGHVVALDGWILSRTEARLCALAAVAPPAC